MGKRFRCNMRRRSVPMRRVPDAAAAKPYFVSVFALQGFNAQSTTPWQGTPDCIDGGRRPFVYRRHWCVASQNVNARAIFDSRSFTYIHPHATPADSESICSRKSTVAQYLAHPGHFLQRTVSQSRKQGRSPGRYHFRTFHT